MSHIQSDPTCSNLSGRNKMENEARVGNDETQNPSNLPNPLTPKKLPEGFGM